MSQVFISYSSDDVDFALTCQEKLEKKDFTVWIDQDAIDAGKSWRDSIDEGIQVSDALVVVVSPSSQESSYVTYEWAFALGHGVKVIPIVLKKGKIHPRLEAIQHLDFSNFSTRPWEKLTRMITQELTTQNEKVSVKTDEEAKSDIRQYLDENGFGMMSFTRIRDNINPNYDNAFLEGLISKYSDELSKATLRGNKAGVKIVRQRVGV